MRVYGERLDRFLHHLMTNELFDLVEERYRDVVGHAPPEGEVSSWRASLPRLADVIRLARLPGDAWISVEERVPYLANRADAVLFGRDAQGRPSVVLVELKAWTTAKAVDNRNVTTPMGGSSVQRPHPSEQVAGYHQHLVDFCRGFHGDRPLFLHSCAYCHNYRRVEGEGLFDPMFSAILDLHPTFASQDASRMATFLSDRLSGGRGEEVVREFDLAGVGPSKELIKHAHEVVSRQRVFTMLDEQIVASNAILRALEKAARARKKQVIVVKGGPGTGKSVVALNALARALERQQEVYLVTGSAAFTHGMRELLGKRLESRIRFTDFFWNHAENSIDVLVIDEAHRIRQKSQPKVPGPQRPRISQTEELIRAARVLVLFMDENQIISPHEAGSPADVAAAARRLGAQYQEYPLPAQIRCNGSSAYLTWLDEVLGLSEVDSGATLDPGAGMRFSVAESPQQLLEEVREKNTASPNSARLVAGWCWKWSDPRPDGTLVNDIVIGEFQFPWEAKNGSKPAAGIPQAKHWAITPSGVDQAGTVYSVQGFEAKHVGVIFGPDLVVRGGAWEAHPRRNFSNDLRAKRPEVARPYLQRIYRTLMTRGMESCSVYFVDEETAQHFRSRLRSAPPTARPQAIRYSP